MAMNTRSKRQQQQCVTKDEEEGGSINKKGISAEETQLPKDGQGRTNIDTSDDVTESTGGEKNDHIEPCSDAENDNVTSVNSNQSADKKPEVGNSDQPSDSKLDDVGKYQKLKKGPSYGQPSDSKPKEEGESQKVTETLLREENSDQSTCKSELKEGGESPKSSGSKPELEIPEEESYLEANVVEKQISDKQKEHVHLVSHVTQHPLVSTEDICDLSDDERPAKLKQPPTAKASKVLYFIVRAIIPIILVLVSWMISSQNEDLRPDDTSQKRQSERSVILAQEMNRLQKEYPTVPQSNWNVVAGASWTHTMDHQRDPERPVVLLLVGRPGKGEIHNFATDVAEMYAKVFSERPVVSIIRIEGAKIEAMPSDDAKLILHNQITSGFESSAKVLLITDFDKLPPCSAILFHAYCDSDNAPFRDVVIIFTMSLETDLPIDATFEDADYVIQNQLQTQWGNCPEEFAIDKMMAIHARVSNNIVFM